MARYGGRGGWLWVHGVAWGDDGAQGGVAGGGLWPKVWGQRCGALMSMVDDTDFSLVTGHGYGRSGMAPWCVRGSPDSLRRGGVVVVSGDVRHQGAAQRQLEMGKHGAR
jgi:hypothetical protein